MKERKNLDRLFQEKFKEFEAEPEEQVWKNIEAALRGKKKRRVVPLWFRLAGVAALFLIGLFTFNTFHNGEIEPTGQPSQGVTSTGTNGASGEGISPAKTLQSKEPSVKIGSGIAHGDNKGLVETDATLGAPAKTGNGVVNIKENSTNSKKSNQTGITPKNTGIVSVGPEASSKEAASQVHKQRSGQDNTVKSSTQVAGVSGGKKKKMSGNNVPSNQTDAVATTKNQPSHTPKAKGNNITHNSSPDARLAVNPAKTKVKTTQKANETQDATTAIAQQDHNKTQGNTGTTPQNAAITNEVIKEAPLKSTEVALTEAKKDSLKQPNELEELLKKSQDKEEKVAVTKADKWQVTTNIAPVYFNSASGGSPIDPQFAQNSKSYDTNISYGVGVNYAVSKRISVRAGVNKFSVGYNTKDVLFYAGLESKNIGNITPSSTGSFIQVVNQTNAASGLLPFEVAIKDNNNVGYINQQMGYIEVPMEMSYKIIDRKFSVSVIGGLSTLFLDENAVSIHSGALTAKMGEANNLNDVHFSSNFGLGLRYRFIKSLELHCEPTFKYQINTFSNDAGNFKPYLIGIYSGLSFSF